MSIKKLAIFYSELSGYMNACLKKLKESYDVELLVYRWPLADNAPFGEDQFKFIDHDIIKKKQDYRQILDKLLEFQPDAVLMSGWVDKDYLKVCRKLKERGIPIIAGSDTQFSNSFRQKIGSWISPWYLHSAIDILWVTGERQRQLAHKLGFTDRYCWDGFYSCDWEKFASEMNSGSLNRSFIFVGRYIEKKGIRNLIEAYQQYRKKVDNPWKLLSVGKGDLGKELNKQEGIENVGFVQPDELPSLFAKSGVFVLPSLKEPWGVVLHEAASAGLPIITTSTCGATTAFLRDRYNGFIIEAGNSKHLLHKLMAVHELSDKEYKNMSKRSFDLSKQMTPELWTKTIVNGLSEFNKNRYE